MSRIVADLVCRSLLCFGLATSIGGLVAQQLNAAAVQHADIPLVVFGSVDDSGVIASVEVIPLVPGQQFGWRARLADEGLHTWKEVLVTPAAPREWLGTDLRITDCGRTGITERTEVAHHGIIGHAWTVTDGDPAGAHEMRIYVDGKHLKTFRFTMQ